MSREFLVEGDNDDVLILLPASLTTSGNVLTTDAQFSTDDYLKRQKALEPGKENKSVLLWDFILPTI